MSKPLTNYSAKKTAGIEIHSANMRVGAVWDKYIGPIAAAQIPPRKGYSWRLNFSWVYRQYAIRWEKASSVLRLAVYATDTGFPILSGLMTLVEGVQYPLDKTKKCIYVWFVESAPSAYLIQRTKLVHPISGEALLDEAINRSVAAGFEGRIVLHAAPPADPQDDHILLDYYRAFGLKRLERSLPRPFGLGTNDGRFFYADEDTADFIIRKNARFRP